jgi:hypothetical protein
MCVNARIQDDKFSMTHCEEQRLCESAIRAVGWAVSFVRAENNLLRTFPSSYEGGDERTTADAAEQL